MALDFRDPSSDDRILPIRRDVRETPTATIGFADINTDINWNGNRIINLGDPTGAQDAATKNYVDGLFPLDHEDSNEIFNTGVNTHTQIDTHISSSSIHFTEASIDHTAIQNIGSNTHAQIDTHISSSSIHFSDLSGFDTDDLAEGATNEYSKWDDATGGINFSGGNVGIGTSSPTGKLHLNMSSTGAAIKLSGVRHFDGANGGDEGVALLNYYTASANRQIMFADSAQLSSTTIPGIRFTIGSAVTEINSVTPSGATGKNLLVNGVITVQNAGNVGIGTTSPATKLEVNGTASCSLVTGTNVTSGEDPGHTHTSASLPGLGALTLIETVNPSSSTSIVIDNADMQNYDWIELIIDLEHTGDFAKIKFNDDPESDNHNYITVTDGGATNRTESNGILYGLGFNQQASLRIMRLAKGNIHLIQGSNMLDLGSFIVGAYWASSSAITKIEIAPNTTGNLTGKVSLYGIKNS